MQRLFVFLFLLVATFSFSQNEKLFLLIDVQESESVNRILRDELGKYLDDANVFYPSSLNDSDYELIIRGLKIIYGGNHIGYSITVLIIFHDPQVVRNTDMFVVVIDTSEKSIRDTAEVFHIYLMSLYNKAIQNNPRSSPPRGSWSNN